VSGICPPGLGNPNISNGAILTVVALPVVTIAPTGPVCGGVPGINGTLLTASGASTYTWAPVAGLYTDAAATIPYTGTQTATVYAAPTAITTYTVTGTNSATGCSNTATILVNYTPPAPIVTPNPVSMCLGDPAVRLISASATPGTCTVNSGAINIPIPDANPSNTQNFTAISTQNVSCIPANATITGISVTLSIPAHTYVADLSLNLKSPGGTVINLFRNLGASGGINTTYPNTGIVNLTLSSASSTSLATANTPAVGTLTGTFKADILNAASTPYYTLSDPPGYPSTATSWTPMFVNAGGAANGTWTLAMTDDGAGDIGSLTNWSIKFDYIIGVQTTPATWSPVGGLFNDAGATIPYAGTPRDTVWTRPTPAGVYTYTVNVSGIGPDALPVFTNPAPITINDNAPATPSPSSIVVSGLPATGVTLDNVKINGFSHTWSGDVNMVLQSPTGQNVILKGNSAGGDPFVSASNVNLTFSDAAGGSLPTTSPMASGTYKPTNYNPSPFTFLPPGPAAVATPVFPASPTLATFTGNLNGTWKLFVEDRVGGDVGSISGGYSITFRYPTPGCVSPARTVTVTVNNPITITTQPVNAVVCTDKVTTFTVVAAGTSPSYQWQVSTDGGNTWNLINNGGVYSGATTATLTITAPPVTMNGYQYRCAVAGANPCPTVFSAGRLLTVNPLPVVVLTASPYLNLLPNIRTTLNVSSSPAAASYLWIRNDLVIAGQTTGSRVVDVDGQGRYYVRVTDVNGCVNKSNIIIIGDSTSGRVFVSPNPTPGRFVVRYNPAHNNVNPRGLVIYDAAGQQILYKEFPLGWPFGPMDIDLSNMATGVYWIDVLDVNKERLAVGRVEIVR
jgi:subtilisin-like proprotein convertase family protein